MTVGHVSLALKHLVHLMEADNRGSSSKGIDALRALLDKHSDAKVPQFTKRLSAIEPQSAGWFGTRVGDILPTLRAFTEMLASLAPKVAKEVAPIVTLLELHNDSDIGAFAKAADALFSAPAPIGSKKPVASANEEVVSRYSAALKSALGTADFAALYKTLSTDKTVRKQEIVEIARRVMTAPP